MDGLSRPQDDLFDNSTMTFGEHLDELRQCLVKAILWLAGGMAIGIFFASPVVRFVQTPLETAIQKFNADRAIYSLGYDPADESIRPMLEFLANNALVLELVYDVPEKFQDALLRSIGPQTSEEGAVNVELEQLAPLLEDPSVLKPRVQLRQNETGLSSLKIEEPFMIFVKAALIVGAVLASPMIFYHIWAFVAAGLHAHERKYVYVYLPISVILFVSGVVLAFFLVLHYVLTFLLAFNGSMDVAVEPRLTYYVNFVLLLPLGFGIAFQLPLVMLFLQRIGLFETEAYIESWKIAVLVIFVISMILTPADVTSMVALAIPLVLLYALGILMCKFIPRGRGLGSSAYDPA